MSNPHYLSNRKIAEDYQHIKPWLSLKDITAQFAHLVVRFSPYDCPDILPALTAFTVYVTAHCHFDCCGMQQFTYDDLSVLLDEKRLASIPEVLVLNQRKNGRDGIGLSTRCGKPDPDDDFIDLTALSRETFYAILRDYITQSNTLEDS